MGTTKDVVFQEQVIKIRLPEAIVVPIHKHTKEEIHTTFINKCIAKNKILDFVPFGEILNDELFKNL